MNQDEVCHCLFAWLNCVDVDAVNLILLNKYKTDIQTVLKAAHPETVYGALHEWARGKE